MTRPSPARGVLTWPSFALFALLIAFFAGSSALQAVPIEIRAHLDVDQAAGNGCSLNTADGTVDDVDYLLVTTVDGGQVIGQSLRQCINGAIANTVPVSAPFPTPWPVGDGLGLDGTSVVEAYVPKVLMGSPLRVQLLAVTAVDVSGAEDALITSPIDGGIHEIPTLSEWMLLLLALFLALSGAQLLRRRRAELLTVILAVGLISAGVVLAADFVLDGQVGDWSGIANLGTDPFGDGPGGADLRTAFCEVEGAVVYLRTDLLLNTGPVAVSDNGNTDEDTVLSQLAGGVTSVLDNDTDPENDPLTVDSFDAVSNLGAAVNVNADGTFTYDPTAAPNLQSLAVGASTQDTFSYVATDGAVLSNTGTVTITVSGVNDTPVANDDTGATTEDSVLSTLAGGATSVLDNDTDIDIGDTLSVVAFDAVSVEGATITVNGDGTFSYDPSTSAVLQALAAGASVDDTFTYTANDGTINSNVATVTVTVTGTDDGPIAVDDTASTTEDTVATMVAPGTPSLLANDTDPENDPLSVASFDAVSAEGAAVVVNADGTFSYDPTGAASLQALDDGGSTQDTFTYTATDGTTTSAPATVTVTVSGVNDAPVAVDDGGSTDEDTVLSTLTGGATSVLDNDTDVDAGDILTVVAFDAASAQGAVVNVNNDGTFSYDPSGVAAFQSLAPGASLQDTFTYTASDGTTNSNVATVTLTVAGANDPPTALDDTGSTDEDTVLSQLTGAVLSVLDNDTDPENDSLSVAAFDALSAQGATVSVNGDGTFTYDPTGAATLQALDDGGSLQDTFTYSVTDGTATSAPATVTVTVGGNNDAPVAVDDGGSTDEDTVLSTLTGGVTSVLANDTDADTGDTLTVVAFDAASAQGAVVNVNNDGTFSYDPSGVAAFQNLAPGASLQDTFTYTASDGTANSNVATVTLTVGGTNDPPTPVNDTGSTDEDTVLSQLTGGVLSVLGNDTDPENDGLTVSAFDAFSAQGAAVNVNNDGTFTYDPTAASALQSLSAAGSVMDTFSYTVSDGTDTAVATVTIDVGGVNDLPTAANDTFNGDEDTVLNIASATGLLANDIDPDVADTLTVNSFDAASTQGAVVSVNGDGSFSYDPTGAASLQALAPGSSLMDTFTYTATDGIATTNVATVTVTVSGINDLPTVVGESFQTVGNTELEVDNDGQTGSPTVYVAGDLLDNDSDIDGPGALSASLNTATAGAVVNVNADGTFTYVPPAGFSGTDSFTYDVSDGSSTMTATAMVTLINEVWYVDNTAAAGGLGRSSDPFDTLAEAETAHGPGDLICVRTGSGTSGLDAGIEILHSNVRLHGEHQGCDVPEGVNGNAGPTALVAASIGNHPTIDHSGGGVGVAVNADSADLTGIAIRGLSIDGDDNAIDIQTANGFFADVLVDNNILTDAGGEGVDVSHDSTATSNVSIQSNTLASTGNSVDARTSDGVLNLRMDNNTDITSGAAGIVLDGSAGGSLFVVSFGGNSVHPDTAGDGVVVNTAVFDADPSDTDFTGDLVDAGTTAVGSVGDGVGGRGVVLNGVSGNLRFADLDVVADGGVGLEASAAGPLNAAAGTGFRLETAAGSTVAATGGPAMDLDPLTLGVTFSSLSSTNSPSTGIRLVDVSGSVTVTGGSITNSTGVGVVVDGAAPMVSYTGDVSNSGSSVLSVANTTGGMVTVDNGTLSTAGGNFAAIAATNTDGSVNVTNSTITHGNGRVIVFNDADGGSSFSGSSVSSTNHHGVSVTNTAGSHTFPNLIIAAGTPSPVDALFLQNNTATLNFGRVAINTNGAGVRGLAALNSGTVNVTDNTSTLASTGGPAVVINPTTVGMTFASVSSTNSNGVGVSLVGASGSFVANGGSISGAAGTAFQVGDGSNNSGGGGTVTYAGSITNAAGRAVEIQDRTGGTVTLSGTINDSGATNSGILVDDNNSGNPTVLLSGEVNVTGTSGSAVTVTDNAGARVSFADLDIDNSATNQTGLFASANGGSGRLEVDTGTVNAGTASAVDIDNTLLANSASTTAGLSLVSVRSVGGTAPGIDLDTTDGAFSVLGAGGNCRDVAAQCSGGLIANKAGAGNGSDGVLLNAATNIQLSHLHLDNINRNGVFANGGNGLVLNQVRVTDVANQASPDEAGIHILNLQGTLNAGANPTRLTNVRVRDSHENNVIVRHTSGTLAELVVDQGVFTNDGGSGQAASNFLVDTGGTANVTVTGTDSTFNGSTTPGMLTAFGFAADAGDSSTLSVDVSASGFRNNNVGLSASASGGASMSFNYSNNTAITGHPSNAINLFANAGHTGTFSGTIANNNIGTLGTMGSGSLNGSGIRFSNEGSATATVAITGNTVREMANFEGIVVSEGVNAGSTNVTITGNTVTDTDFDRALVVNLTSGGSVCANISGNTFANIASATDLRVRQTSGTFNIVQLAPTGAVNPAELDDANGGAAVSQAGTLNFGAAVCPTP